MVRGKCILARCGTASRHRAVQNRLALAAEALHAQGPDAAAPELRQNLLLEAAIGPVKAVERQLDGAERIFVRQTEPAEVRTVAERRGRPRGARGGSGRRCRQRARASPPFRCLSRGRSACAAIFSQESERCPRARVAARRPPVVTRSKASGGGWVSMGCGSGSESRRVEMTSLGDGRSRKLLGVVLCVLVVLPGLAACTRAMPASGEAARPAMVEPPADPWPRQWGQHVFGLPAAVRALRARLAGRPGGGGSRG